MTRSRFSELIISGEQCYENGFTRICIDAPDWIMSKCTSCHTKISDHWLSKRNKFYCY